MLNEIDKMFVLNVFLVILGICFMAFDTLYASSYIDSTKAELQQRAEHTEYTKILRGTTSDLVKLTKINFMDKKAIYYKLKSIADKK